MYCVNPDCPNPSHPGDTNNCVHCGTSLLLGDRYYLTRPIRTPQPRDPTRIFEAEDVESDTPKVVKVLIDASRDRITLLRRELKFLVARNAPGKIPLADIGGYFTCTPSNNQVVHCLAMELIEGINLEEWVNGDGQLTEDLAINWLHQLTKILEIVHNRGFFHRDIKPSNIMLRPDGQLALIDFGAVREVTDTYLLRLHNDNPSTPQPITIIGSEGYNPTEQLYGKAVPQSDFFAMGRTFVHLLTRVHPALLPFNVVDGKLQWLDRAPQVSPSLANFLDGLMAPNWRNRPVDTQAIQKILERLPGQIRRNRFLRSWEFKTMVGVSGLAILALSIWSINSLQVQQQQSRERQRQEQTQQLLDQGAQAQVSQRYEEAREKYERALKLDPNSAKAYNSLALLCQSQEKYQCAIENYQKSLKLQPDRPVTLYNLGSLYDDLQDYYNAERYYRRLLSLKTIPGVDSKNNLARIQVIQGKYGEAIRLTTQALSETSDPVSQASILKNLAWAEYKLGQLDQAGDKLEKARTLDSRVDIYCLLAQIRQAQGETEASKIYRKQCLQRNDATSKQPEVQQWREELVNQFLQ